MAVVLLFTLRTTSENETGNQSKIVEHEYFIEYLSKAS